MGQEFVRQSFFFNKTLQQLIDYEKNNRQAKTKNSVEVPVENSVEVPIQIISFSLRTLSMIF